MTAGKVIDASALAAVTFIEPHTSGVAERLHEHKLFAPTLLRFEMAHICIKKIRARPTERDAILSQYASSLQMQVQLSDIDHMDLVKLAEQLNLSAYDASYLWLARKLDIELITLDKQLEKAASKI